MDDTLKGLLVAADAGDAQAGMSAVRYYVERDDLDGALTWVQESSPDARPHATYAVGLILTKLGRGREARQWYTKGAVLGHPPSMNDLGIALLRVNEDRLAERWLRRAARAGHIGAVTNLGRLLQSRGTWEEAASQYSEAVERANWEPARRALEQLEAERPVLEYWDALEFTTFGWRQTKALPTARQWALSTSHLHAVFVPTPISVAAKAQLRADLKAKAERPGAGTLEAGGEGTRDVSGDAGFLGREGFSITGAWAGSGVFLTPSRSVQAMTIVALADFFWMFRIDRSFRDALSDSELESEIEQVEALEAELRQSLHFNRSMADVPRLKRPPSLDLLDILH